MKPSTPTKRKKKPTDSEKEQIQIYLSQGLSQRKIARTLGLSLSVISRIRKEHFPDLQLVKGGRPNVIDDETKQIIRDLALNEQAKNAVEIVNYLKSRGIVVSTNSVRRALKSTGLEPVLFTKDPLEPANKEARYQFALTYANWTLEQWKSVIWCDEALFPLLRNDGTKLTWMKKLDNEEDKVSIDEGEVKKSSEKSLETQENSISIKSEANIGQKITFNDQTNELDHIQSLGNNGFTLHEQNYKLNNKCLNEQEQNEESFKSALASFVEKIQLEDSVRMEQTHIIKTNEEIEPESLIQTKHLELNDTQRIEQALLDAYAKKGELPNPEPSPDNGENEVSLNPADLSLNDMLDAFKDKIAQLQNQINANLDEQPSVVNHTNPNELNIEPITLGGSTHLKKPTLKHSRRDHIKMWGCVGWEGCGIAQNIIGKVNSEMYIDILEKNLLESLPYLKVPKEGMIFCQPDYPSLRTEILMRWIEQNNIILLKFPLQSEDINPIGRLWTYIRRKLDMYDQDPEDVSELWSRIENIWKSIDAGVVQGIISDIPRRLQLVINAKGGYPRFKSVY